MVRVFALLLLAALPLAAAEQKPAAPVTVRIHAEGRPSDGANFGTEITLINPPKKITISKVPVTSEKDFVAFFPFPAADGSLGAYFKLDAHGTNKLESHSTEFRDTLVVALVNGRVASAMTVDKKITDGILLIPSGFQPEEIVRLQSTLPTIGKEKEFATQKKKALDALKAQALEQKKLEPKPTVTPKPKKK